MSDTVIWPTLRYADPHAAIAFLVDAFGFEKVAVYEEGGTVAHAELRGPSGGGVMLGGADRADSPICGLPPGTGSIYIVVKEPDALFERATKAGSTVVMAPHDTDYGSRDFTVRDPEGVYWNFGTYGGAAS